MPRDKIRVQGVLMTRDAAQRVEDTGTDVQTDIRKVQAGMSRETLLEFCLDGFEETEDVTASSWQEYVDAVFEAVGPAPVTRLLTCAESVIKLYTRGKSPTKGSAKDWMTAFAALRDACEEVRTTLK